MFNVVQGVIFLCNANSNIYISKLTYYDHIIFFSLKIYLSIFIIFVIINKMYDVDTKLNFMILTIQLYQNYDLSIFHQKISLKAHICTNFHKNSKVNSKNVTNR